MSAESTTPAALRFLSTFFWVKGHPETFSQTSLGRMCVKAWRIYWHAESCDLRKVRHEWNLQEPALAAPLSFQSPHALFLIMCNMLVICVCVWWVTALIVKGSGRFGLKCTTTHAARVYKQNITQESQLVLVHRLGRTSQTPLKGVG